MHIKLEWRNADPSSQFPSLCAHAGITNSESSSVSRERYVESFISKDFQIIVELDDIPISSFVVHVHRLQAGFHTSHLQATTHHPIRLHFGSSFDKCHEWRHVHNVYLEPIPSASDSYVTSYQFPFSSDGIRFPPAISFVIQLSDGTWLRNCNGSDFHVGTVPIDCPPSCLELLFTWPVACISSSKILSLHRVNPFWLVPHFPSSLPHCKNETFFILAELDTAPLVTYVAVVFCVDGTSGIRSSLFATDALESLPALRLETGLCFPLRVSSVQDSLLACLVCRDDPYDAVHGVVALMADAGLDVSTAARKISSDSWTSLQSPLQSRLGYCTWDAFGSTVTMDDVITAVKWLHRHDIPIGYVIVDDGWQTVSLTDGQEGGPHSAVLTELRANGKFGHSLKHLIDKLDAQVFAWTNVLGYWGGASLDSESEYAIRTLRVSGRQARGLLFNDVEDARYWEREYEVVHPTTENLEIFFGNYLAESMSKRQGISSVKIDAQSILDLVCQTPEAQDNISRLELTRLYRTAFSKAVATAFPNAIVMNCMACGPEAILSSGAQTSGSNVCWRTSNDHAFPNVEENAAAVAWHILSNVMVCILLGEIFPLVDWDMFRVAAANDTDGRFARIHAVARVVSGGPIYISDFAPFVDGVRCSRGLELLRQLTASDGRLLRCVGVARPTKDCLFQDVRWGDVRLLKVFNRNSVNGVLAMFNLRCGEEEDALGKFCPGDIRDFANVGSSDRRFVSLVCGQEGYVRLFVHTGLNDPCDVQVRSMDVAMIHICPVLEIVDGVSFCAIGQERLINGGGVVKSIGYSIAETVISIDVSLEDGGDCLLWMQLGLDMEMESIKTCEGEVVNVRSALDDSRVLKVSVESQKPCTMQLRIVPRQ